MGGPRTCARTGSSSRVRFWMAGSPMESITNGFSERVVKKEFPRVTYKDAQSCRRLVRSPRNLLSTVEFPPRLARQPL